MRPQTSLHDGYSRRLFAYQRQIAVLGLILFFASASARSIEEPNFTVVVSWAAESIEIREYDARILMHTSMKTGANSGFRVLAGYIFGGNAREQSIAMTAPVQRTMPQVTDPEMAFVVPREYQLDDLPRPNDTRVGFREEPSYRAAVIRFSGWATDNRAEREWETLQAFLSEKGIRVLGEPTLNQYNPPWTLPFLRRNEIIVAVDQ